MDDIFPPDGSAFDSPCRRRGTRRQRKQATSRGSLLSPVAQERSLRIPSMLCIYGGKPLVAQRFVNLKSRRTDAAFPQRVPGRSFTWYIFSDLRTVHALLRSYACHVRPAATQHSNGSCGNVVLSAWLDKQRRLKMTSRSLYPTKAPRSRCNSLASPQLDWAALMMRTG